MSHVACFLPHFAHRPAISQPGPYVMTRRDNRVHDFSRLLNEFFHQWATDTRPFEGPTTLSRWATYASIPRHADGLRAVWRSRGPVSRPSRLCRQKTVTCDSSVRNSTNMASRATTLSLATISDDRDHHEQPDEREAGRGPRPWRAAPAIWSSVVDGLHLLELPFPSGPDAFETNLKSWLGLSLSTLISIPDRYCSGMMLASSSTSPKYDFSRAKPRSE